MSENALRTEEWWNGRRQGLTDAAEVLRKCGDQHCQDMALRIAWLANIATQPAPKSQRLEEKR